MMGDARGVAGHLLPALLAIVLAGATQTASAHALDPSYLSLEATDADHVRITWKLARANAKSSFDASRPRLRAGCGPAEGLVAIPAETFVTYAWSHRCALDELRGTRVALPAQVGSRSPLLVRMLPAGAPAWQSVVPPGTGDLVLPGTGQRGGYAGYAVFGAKHILAGLDHLAYLLALLLILGGAPRSLLLSLTGFTIGHSATLVLVVTGTAVVPRATEALIALSVLFMARAAIDRRRRSLLGGRLPMLASTLVGLLHGLGFAGALGDLDPASGSLPATLLAFNAGIEAGQIAFVAVALALARAVPAAWRARACVPACYALGISAGCWTLLRTMALFDAGVAVA